MDILLTLIVIIISDPFSYYNLYLHQQQPSQLQQPSDPNAPPKIRRPIGAVSILPMGPGFGAPAGSAAEQQAAIQARVSHPLMNLSI